MKKNENNETEFLKTFVGAEKEFDRLQGLDTRINERTKLAL